jgi:hypothetical protein
LCKKGRIIPEEFGVAMPNHVRTGTRGDHKRHLDFCKEIHSTSCHDTRFIPVAGVESWLPTASLFSIEVDRAARVRQHFDNGLTCLGKEAVYQAGYEKLDFH